MSYSTRFHTRAASDEHYARIKELKEIMLDLEDYSKANSSVIQTQLARVIELLIQELV